MFPVCYPINGLGLVCDFNLLKEEFDFHFAEDIFDAMDTEVETPISWAFDGETAYYLYKPEPYYLMSDIEKSFTSQDDVAREMYKVLKPFLKEEVNVDYFIENIGEIATCGYR